MNKKLATHTSKGITVKVIYQKPTSMTSEFISITNIDLVEAERVIVFVFQVESEKALEMDVKFKTSLAVVGVDVATKARFMAPMAIVTD